MTTDPDEGIAPDGTITTGARRDRIAATYEPVLLDAVHRLEELLAGNLVAVYVYGSVATGRAEVPRSDIDLTAVVRDDPDLERLDHLNEALTTEYHAVAREVTVGLVTQHEVNATSDAGHAWRCFLKHYGVLLSGDDVAADFPRCQPTRRLALGFAGDFKRTVEAQLATARTATAAAERDDALARAARRLLLAAAPLTSVLEGDWSTDRARATELIEERYPQQAASAQELLQAVTTRSAQELRLETLEAFHDWLSTDLVPAVRRPAAPAE